MFIDLIDVIDNCGRGRATGAEYPRSSGFATNGPNPCGENPRERKRPFIGICNPDVGIWDLQSYE